MLNKAKREQYDFSGRAPLAEAFSQLPPGGEAASNVAGSLCRLARCSRRWPGTEAWAAQRWGHDAAGYRFDVLAAVVLKYAAAAGPTASGGARSTRDVYRLGSGAVALGIQNSRLVSGHRSEGGEPASLQQEIDACVPRSLAVSRARR